MCYSADAAVSFGFNLGTLYDDETFEFTGPAWMVRSGYTYADEFDQAAYSDLYPPEDFDDVLATLLGWQAFVGPVDFQDKESAGYKAWDVSYLEKRRLIADAGLADIELERYGHFEDDERPYMVRVKSSAMRVDCLRSLVVDPAVMAQLVDDHPEWIEALRKFAHLLELPVTGDPAWVLTVSYG